MTHYHPSALTFKLFYIMGLPSIMTTDQGREFCNHVNKELMNTCLRNTASSHNCIPPPSKWVGWAPESDIGEQLGKVCSGESRYIRWETAWSCVCIQHSCARVYKAHTVRGNVQKNGSSACRFQCLHQLWCWCQAKGIHGHQKPMIALNVHPNTEKTEEAVKSNIEQAHKRSKWILWLETWCSSMLQRWLSCPKKGLYS